MAHEFIAKKGLIVQDLSGNTTLGTNYDSAYTTNFTVYSGLTISKYIDFNTGNTIVNSPGRLFFDKNENALSYNPVTPNNDVTINLGQEELIRVYNNTGSAITNGQALHIMGSLTLSGQSYPTVMLSNANQNSDMYQVSGIATHDIADGATGFITNFGLVHNLNLSAFNNGDEVYLSDTISGGLCKYSDLDFKSRTTEVGWIISNDSVNGILLVKIMNENSYLTIPQRQLNVIASDSVSTGIYDWSGLTFSGNTFSVKPVKGWIVNNVDNVTDPEVKWINYTGQTNISTPYLNTDTNTYVLLNSASTLLLQNIYPTPQQRRENLYLGRVTHVNFTNISSVSSEPDITLSPMSQVRDMFAAINFINVGISPTYASNNLTFKTSAGSLYHLGINWISNRKSPSTINISAQNPATFQYRTQFTGGTFTNTTTIDPSHYDVNDVITAIGGAGKQATNQRIWLFPTGLIRVQYGQNVYATLAEAIAGVQTEQFISYPAGTQNGVLIGVLSLRIDSTNLSDINQARFIPVSKFGENLGGAAGISTTTLQQAYDNSSNPEIVTNSTQDGLQIKGGTGNDNDKNLIIQNNSSVETGWIKANGDTYFNKISAINGINVSGLSYLSALTSGDANINNLRLGNDLYLPITGANYYASIDVNGKIGYADQTILFKSNIGTEYYNLIFDTGYPFDKVLVYSAGTYTDWTESASRFASDITFYPFGDPTNYMYVGLKTKFSAILFASISPRGSGVTFQADYWNGTAWTNLSFTDGTSGATVIERNDTLGYLPALQYTAPSDWTGTTVSGTSLYWIRVRSTTIPTINPGMELVKPSINRPWSIKTNTYDTNTFVRIDDKGFFETEYLMRFTASAWNVLEFYASPAIKVKNTNPNKSFNFSFDDYNTQYTLLTMSNTQTTFNVNSKAIDFSILNQSGTSAYFFNATLNTNNFNSPVITNSGLTVNNSLNVTGNTTLNGNIIITGDTTFYNNYKFNTNAFAIVSTTPYNIQSYQSFIGTSGVSALTLNLPSAATFGIGQIIIKDTTLNANTRNITINRSGSDTIINTGTAAVTSLTISTRGGSYTLFCDGISKWFVV